MSEAPKTTPPSAWKHYLKLVLVTLVLAAGVCVAAYFQNEIKLFFKMKVWDRKAPANVVVQFLTAAKEGHLEATPRYVVADRLGPVKEGDQLVGYIPQVPMGSPPPVLFTDLLPEGDIQVTSVLFRYTGSGSGEVEVPGKKGILYLYSLDYTPSGWKIRFIGPTSPTKLGEKGP